MRQSPGNGLARPARRTNRCERPFNRATNNRESRPSARHSSRSATRSRDRALQTLSKRGSVPRRGPGQAHSRKKPPMPPGSGALMLRARSRQPAQRPIADGETGSLKPGWRVQITPERRRADSTRSIQDHGCEHDRGVERNDGENLDHRYKWLT